MPVISRALQARDGGWEACGESGCKIAAGKLRGQSVVTAESLAVNIGKRIGGRFPEPQGSSDRWGSRLLFVETLQNLLAQEE